MATRPHLRGTSSLVGGVLSTLIVLSPVAAWAQTAPAPAPQEGDRATQTVPVDQNADGTATEVEEVVVTGSRIPSNEFTSASPVQVITAARAEQRGISDTAQFLQSSTLAAGPPSVTLRGLGANRTLVLLNGRRAGPAGTRGGVSSFDLNVIPQSAINRVDILKDGASSIYGSDAVAGVVNLVTERARDGGEMSAFASVPFEKGGEQYNISGTFGKTFDRGYLNVSADYYRQEALRAGDRDYLTCTNQYVFQPGTRTRADRIDPRTGQPTCNDTVWGNIYVYSSGFAPRPGRFQYDYEGNLGQYIPTRPTNPATSAQYPTAPAGFYIVGYDPASRAVVNALPPQAAESSIIPETERYTAFIEGAYEVGGGAELYGEFLLNRRESRTDGFRQFWNYTYTNDFLDFYYGPGAGGDP
ncbi:MAG: TonB-dependent receptor, partial [Caulobacteraceae bacterium]